MGISGIGGDALPCEGLDVLQVLLEPGVFDGIDRFGIAGVITHGR